DVLPGVQAADQPAVRGKESDPLAQRGAPRRAQAVALDAEQHQPRLGLGAHFEYRAHQPLSLRVAQGRDAVAPAQGNPYASALPIRGVAAERHVQNARPGLRGAESLAVTRPKKAWPNTR